MNNIAIEINSFNIIEENNNEYLTFSSNIKLFEITQVVRNIRTGDLYLIGDSITTSITTYKLYIIGVNKKIDIKEKDIFIEDYSINFK